MLLTVYEEPGNVSLNHLQLEQIVFIIVIKNKNLFKADRKHNI